MSRQRTTTDRASFERRLGELLVDYARAADRPFEPLAIAGAAADRLPRFTLRPGPIRMFGPSPSTSWMILVLVGLLAALLGGAIVIGGSIPVPLPPHPPSDLWFAPDEILVEVNGEVLAMNSASGERRAVATGSILAVSPDRTRIVRATADPEGRLMITDVRGTDLAEIPVEAVTATWSQDGRYVAVSALFEDPSGSPVTGWNPRTGELMTYLPGYSHAVWDTTDGDLNGLRGFPSHPSLAASWGPNSLNILLTSRGSLVITDLEGRLGETVAGPANFGLWAPTGEYILHAPQPGPDGRLPASLELLSVGPGFSTELAAQVPFIDLPAWSPDGRRWAGFTEEGVAVGGLDDPGTLRVVYRDPTMLPLVASERPWRGVAWSPDGRTLAFVVSRNGLPALLAVDAAGGPARSLVSPDDRSLLGSFDW